MPFKGLDGLYQLPEKLNDRKDNSFSHYIAHKEALRAISAYEHALDHLKKAVIRFEEKYFAEASERKY